MLPYGYSRPLNRVGWSPYRWSSILWIGGGILGSFIAWKFAPKPANGLARGTIGFLGGAFVLGAVGDKFIENNHPDSNSQR